jgi:DNA-binding NarL/FixJ family response regulator
MTAPDGPPNPLRIVVADDQASVRQGLVVLLGLLPDIEVVASAANGEEALRVVADTHPDAILLDLRMPVLDGIEAARRLTERHPDVAIVIMTTYDDDTSIVASLRAGARGYLTKDTDRADIAQALRGAVTGLTVLGPASRATVVAAAAQSEQPSDPYLPAPRPGGLTRREAEILTLIARGLTNPGIAARLRLSPHTVKSHINRIFAKTGASDRAEAVRYAHEHDLA